MKIQRALRSESFCLIIAFLAIAVGFLMVAGSNGEVLTPKSPAKALRLLKNNRELLATMKARGEKELTVLVAVHPKGTENVVSEMVRLGGTVRYRADELGYIRAIIPFDRIMTLAHLKQIQGFDIDLNSNLIDPTRKYPPPTEEPSSVPPDPDTPLSHPALPLKDIDADGFLAENPSFDGRGVGFALIDGTIDMLLPEFQKAKSLDGNEIPKIADILAATDPISDRDPMWANMTAQVEAKAGKFTHQDILYIAPKDSFYRLGFFDERALEEPAYLYKDVNFDGNPQGSSGLYGILWEEKTNTVWVDTNQDKSFADEKPLTDFALRREIGIFGKDKPETARRESVGFAVQTNMVNKFIRLNLGVWQHATMVAGAAVGNGFYGGKYNGIAGEAQLISIWPGSSMHGLVEGAILAARHKKVELICLEPDVSMPAMYSLCDGRLVASIVFARLVERYQKPIFCPANNSPGMSTILDYIVGTKVIGAGAYQSKESYRVNYGVEAEEKDNLHIVSSFGPGGNGALVPVILSPSGIISADCGYKPPARLKGVYELPPGYSIASGTSTAGPSATAACALLISAAKQAGIRYDMERLRSAIFSSARFLPQFAAYKQGNGLIQVNAAWKFLKAMDKKYVPIEIEARAPVKTELSYLLEKPDQGVGIFEREGWAPGQSGERTISFIRRSGSSIPLAFNLEWVGNDGTFSCPRTITLPLNQPVDLQVTIATKESGVKSAILNLKNPAYPMIAHQVLNTIVVAEQFNDANNFSVRKRDLIERPGWKSLFFYIPPRIPVLQFDLELPEKAKVRAAIHPSTGYDDNSFDLAEEGHWRKTILKPVPGVWEIVFWNNNFAFEYDKNDAKPLTPTSIDLTARLVSVETVPHSWEIQNWSKGGTFEQKFDINNKLAAFPGQAGSAALGSAFTSSSRISDQEQIVYEIEVPPGSQMLMAKIAQASDPKTDLDLYLFEVVDGIAVLRKKSTGKSADEAVMIESPKGGKWKVVVDAFHVPGGSTVYSYKDLFNHELFGTINTNDHAAQREVKAIWIAGAKANITAIPVNGRLLGGLVPIIWQPVMDEKTLKEEKEKGEEKKKQIIIGYAEILFKE